MSAPDKIYAQIDGVGNLNKSALDGDILECVTKSDRRDPLVVAPLSVHTYHHDLVLQAANAEIADLKARLDGLVKAASSPALEFRTRCIANIEAQDNLKSAIEAAKGGE